LLLLIFDEMQGKSSPPHVVPKGNRPVKFQGHHVFKSSGGIFDAGDVPQVDFMKKGSVQEFRNFSCWMEMRGNIFMARKPRIEFAGAVYHMINLVSEIGESDLPI